MTRVGGDSRPCCCSCCSDPMKRALILQHMDHDHPGRFADFFSEDGIVPKFVRLFEGQSIPRLADFDFMMVLGGAQDTWQQDEYPWLVEEKQAIREWVWDRAKPYWGICLGHQLLCDSLGGEVALADAGEVGVHDLRIDTSHAFTDGIESEQRVMQWHFAEVKRVPQQALVLASSVTTNAQCVAIDSHAIGTQFHCEFTPQTIAGWSSLPLYVAALERHLGVGAYPRLVAESYPQMPNMARNTKRMWDNFKRSSGLV
jgi:GMP synthase-like glutamine amidotransferase